MASCDDFVIVLDTETTGLPEQSKNFAFFPPSNYSKYNSSRLIELGYYIYNKKGAIITTRNMLIFSKTFTITNSKIHGITQEHCIENGIPLDIALEQLLNDIRHCDTIVAHNLEFDFNIILAECYRSLAFGKNETAEHIICQMNNMHQICTMKLGMEKLKKTRRIKLVQLYEELTGGQKWDQQHRAEDDARVCGECYWLMVQM